MGVWGVEEDDLIELHTAEYALLPSVNEDEVILSSLSADSCEMNSVQRCECIERYVHEFRVSE